MRIAEQKLNENISEYILYMYQIEDIIRAFDFDIERIMTQFVMPQLPDSSFEGRYRKWYQGLIADMQSERIVESGHRMELQEILTELSYLHNTLLSVVNDEKYKTLVDQGTPLIEEFKSHSNLKDKNLLEICFQGLYMKLLLKLQKKPISQETEEAFDAMRIIVAYLARAYHRMKNGDGQFWNN